MNVEAAKDDHQEMVQVRAIVSTLNKYGSSEG